MHSMIWPGAIAIVIIACITPALTETLTCSTWQGIRTCSSPDGYRSTKWDRDGMRFGQDNRGERWTTSRWMGIDTTTVSSPGR
jgi:hypothetical protein